MILGALELECDASSAIAISSKSGVGKTRHIQTRFLWVQDAVRDKELTIKKTPSETNVADLGTKPLDPKRHQMLPKMLPLRVPAGIKRLVGLLVASSISTAGSTNPAAVVHVSVESEISYATIATAELTLATVAIGCCVGIGSCGRRQDRNARHVGVQASPDVSDAQVQSQTTYTALRGVAHPRFQPLAEPSHG